MSAWGRAGVAIRPGEHACCRTKAVGDCARVSDAFVEDGLRRGNKAIYLCERNDRGRCAERLRRRGDHFAEALARGQLEVLSDREAYRPDGRFEVERTIAVLRAAHAGALAAGYAGLSATGDLTWASDVVIEPSELTDYETRLNVLAGDPTLTLLCRYDTRRFASGALDGMIAAHDVDVTPSLAALGLGAALVQHGSTVRLAGELDIDDAHALELALDDHGDGDRSLDLADLSFVDLAGMRALRGRPPEHVTIVDASPVVRRLLALLGWDDDPRIDLREDGGA